MCSRVLCQCYKSYERPQLGMQNNISEATWWIGKGEWNISWEKLWQKRHLVDGKGWWVLLLLEVSRDLHPGLWGKLSVSCCSVISDWDVPLFWIPSYRCIYKLPSHRSYGIGGKFSPLIMTSRVCKSLSCLLNPWILPILWMKVMHISQLIGC